MSQLELLALIETGAASRSQPQIDRHEENEEEDYLCDALERWRDRKFNRRHTEH